MKYASSLKAFFSAKGLALSVFLLLTSALFLTASPVQARAGGPLRLQAGASNSVTVLILDMSGSMNQNDPRGYRCSAADAFIDMSGPGNFIGVIGLDGTGNRGGTHNFDLAQQWTPDPMDMSVESSRTQLKHIIQQKSHNCAPDSNTPTYDALAKALQMLENAALSAEIPGSVVLLTDGEPDDGGPADAAAQINAIQTELLPQFRQHNWPIDTVALGQNAPVSESGTQFATFHDFLQGISNATDGVAYDDAKGVVPGNTPNALNIAPFFADIFARHNGRTLKKDIGVTPLAGVNSPVKRNFNVAPYSSHLDIITVTDQPGARVTLLDPNGQVINSLPGVARHTGNYYTIFSIDNPQPGLWELDVQGDGQFLMESLNKTTLALAPPAVRQNGLTQKGASHSFALGQPLTITTSLSNQGVAVSDLKTYTVQGNIAYHGAAGDYSQDFALHGDPSGTYSGTVTVPAGKPVGAYLITIEVSIGSRDNILATATLDTRMGLFPVPLLLVPGGAPTANAVDAQSVEWDPVLRFLYNLPWPGFLSQWALQGHPVGKAVVPGEVTLNNQAYNGATINATASQRGSNRSSSADIQMGNNGNFSLLLPVTTSGTYTVSFNTSGTFADTQGDFGTTQNTVNVTVVPSNLLQEVQAWLLTLIYFWCLICLLNLFRFFVMAHPFGGWIQNQDGEVVGRFAFNRSRRNPFQAYFRPNLVRSRQASLPEGLIFRFKRQGGIEVCPDGRAGAAWQRADGAHLRSKYEEVHELRYVPGGLEQEDEDIQGTIMYTLVPNITGKSSEDDDNYGSASSRRRANRRRQTRQWQKSQIRKNSYEENDYSYDFDDII